MALLSVNGLLMQGELVAVIHAGDVGARNREKVIIV
jgi:hypothetical protein